MSQGTRDGRVTACRLAEAARRDRRITDARERLEDRPRELASAVRSRAEYSVVHGELGLNHVLVDPAGNPVMTQRLSLIAGPLRLLDGDFPDREFMQEIAEWNLNKALEFLD